ncbi:sulfotransferase family protein [Shimia isoporae]|uniref:Sulfotransferase family protein n=1 Tax=Shimia isoporae TaxID=647720 RepID=A0A4R1NQR3_9RHOB|nr:sulfotransferase family 2 domain-containing protein [Shimia isoporae]TCL09053.1 sulfotransferase family protein [Shimia isoporae]
MQNKVILVHIPKTAGSSLRSALAFALGNLPKLDAGIIGVDRGVEGLPYFEGLAEAARASLPRLFADGLQIMSGHFRYRDIVPVLAGRQSEVSLVTFLRDPVKRTVSDYLYSCSEKHPGHLAFQAEYPTLGDYVKSPGQMNKQFDYLRPREGASVEETAEAALKAFDFIGMTERFDDDLKTLLPQLSLGPVPPTRENVAGNTAQSQQVMTQYGELLREALAPEMAMYSAISERLEQTRT